MPHFSAFLLIALFAFVFFPQGARAHVMPAQQGTINIIENRAYIVMALPVSAFSRVDDDGDGALSAAEIGRHEVALQSQFNARFVLSSGADKGVAALTMIASPQTGDAAQSPTAYILVMQVRTFMQKPRSLVLSTDLFGRGQAERQIALRASRPTADGKSEKIREMAVLTPDRATHRFFAGAWEGFVDFLYIGATHILSGYDHLLFLLTVFAAGSAARQALPLISMFTIAHSLTLALAATHLVSVSPRIVEPLIAVSIIAVAIDNLVFGSERSLRGRSAVVFACGLLHGLGFASAITNFRLDSKHWLSTMAGFNLGIELGQALFLCAVFACFAVAGRWSGLHLGGALPKFASSAAVVLGLALLVQRL